MSQNRSHAKGLLSCPSGSPFVVLVVLLVVLLNFGCSFGCLCGCPFGRFDQVGTDQIGAGQIDGAGRCGLVWFPQSEIREECLLRFGIFCPLRQRYAHLQDAGRCGGVDRQSWAIQSTGPGRSKHSVARAFSPCPFNECRGLELLSQEMYEYSTLGMCESEGPSLRNSSRNYWL